MAYFAVTYTYGPDLATQDANRADHRAFLGQLAADRKLVASGPLVGTAPASALIVLRAGDAQEAAAFLRDDPFQQLGQVQGMDVVEWKPVIGILADTL